jgi:hypothetical protein
MNHRSDHTRVDVCMEIRGRTFLPPVPNATFSHQKVANPGQIDIDNVGVVVYGKRATIGRRTCTIAILYIAPHNVKGGGA